MTYNAVAFSQKMGATPRVSPKMVATTPAQTDFCWGLPGNIAPAGNFDPANLLEGKTANEVYRFREAELTHGRVGMLAAAGFLVQEAFHPLFNGLNGPAIDQIPQLPVPLWFAMTLGVGIAETVRIQKGWANPYAGAENIQSLKTDYYPGDLNFDPLGLKPEDPAEFRLMQERELSHGRVSAETLTLIRGYLPDDSMDALFRPAASHVDAFASRPSQLGMLAAAGFLAQEAATGKTWGAQDLSFENFLLGPYFSQQAAELAQDAMAKELVPNLMQ
jgi:hypothetical protein